MNKLLAESNQMVEKLSPDQQTVQKILYEISLAENALIQQGLYFQNNNAQFQEFQEIICNQYLLLIGLQQFEQCNKTFSKIFWFLQNDYPVIDKALLVISLQLLQLFTFDQQQECGALLNRILGLQLTQRNWISQTINIIELIKTGCFSNANTLIQQLTVFHQHIRSINTKDADQHKCQEINSLIYNFEYQSLLNHFSIENQQQLDYLIQTTGALYSENKIDYRLQDNQILHRNKELYNINKYQIIEELIELAQFHEIHEAQQKINL